MRSHQSGDFPGVRSRQVVTAAANDAKIGTGQQLMQSLADGKRADQVSIAPDQQARDIDRGQFDRQIRAGLARFGDPRGSLGKFTPIICAPIRPAQITHRHAAGSHGQDKPADPVRSRKRHAQRDEPAQGLSDQVRRSVEFSENHRYEIVEALNPDHGARSASPGHAKKCRGRSGSSRSATGRQNEALAPAPGRNSILVTRQLPIGQTSHATIRAAPPWSGSRRGHRSSRQSPPA